MIRKKTHAYTEEFRREAVKRADQEGTTNAAVSASSITPNCSVTAAISGTPITKPFNRYISQILAGSYQPYV